MQTPFPDSYLHARQLFHKAVVARPSLRLDSYTVQHPEAVGPKSEPLAIDFVQIGNPRAPTVLVISSGVHGIEGFAGSHAQSEALLSDTFNKLGDISVFLVHALNPYGFAHLRRGNEDNVDLNRNFIDWAAERPKEHLLTGVAYETMLGKHASIGSAADFIDQYGSSACQAALINGQYTYPNSLCYGGTGPAWSNDQWSHAISHFAGHAERVIHLDLHTGYGPAGEATLMSSAVVNTPLAAEAQRIWGKKILLEADAAEFSAVQGPIEQSLPRLLPSAQVMTTTLEIGARPLADNVRALLAEQSARNRNEPTLLMNAQLMMRRCYAPGNPHWQQQALAAQLGVIRQTVAALS